MYLALQNEKHGVMAYLGGRKETVVLIYSFFQNTAVGHSL